MRLESKQKRRERGTTTMTHFGQYQDGIYLAGLHGIVPKLPIDMATLEKKAM
jgi:hypothetical protein